MHWACITVWQACMFPNRPAPSMPQACTLPQGLGLHPMQWNYISMHSEPVSVGHNEALCAEAHYFSLSSSTPVTLIYSPATLPECALGPPNLNTAAWCALSVMVADGAPFLFCCRTRGLWPPPSRSLPLCFVWVGGGLGG